MESIGEKLLISGVVTGEQLDTAQERQRRFGGRLGTNLIALGYLSAQQVKQYFHEAPPAPLSVTESKLDRYFIGDLITKQVVFMGGFTPLDVVETCRLPLPVVLDVLETMRRDRLIEVKGATSYLTETYSYKVTELGARRAAELLDLCRYTGPAPVSLEDYQHMVEMQTIKNIEITDDRVRNAFSHLVLKDDLLKRIGPAVMSGQAMFVYGPSGNGKTAIAEAIGGIPGDTVFVPHAITVGGQIITVYDPVNHLPVPPDDSGGEVDRRWVQVRRPVVMTGGELKLEMLDLEFNPVSRYYEGSLQLKANNGVFIADDFGRQRINPDQLLNRWIVPLDRRVDFLHLHTGMMFTIPFDMLVVFSTNLEPRKLADEAFLRRIPYKLKIDSPTREEYRHIFQRECEKRRFEFNQEAFDHLQNNYYEKFGLIRSGCHPRNLLEQVELEARYNRQPLILSGENIDRACRNYFLEN